MADYFSLTVVQPTIPNADMTPLEQLLLTQIESEPDDDGLYFFAEIMPADQFELPIEALRAALAASDGIASETATFVLDHIKNIGEDDSDVEFDPQRDVMGVHLPGHRQEIGNAGPCHGGLGVHLHQDAA